VDRWSRWSFSEAQIIPVQLSNPHPTREVWASTTLHCSYYYGSQHGNSGRMA
jgi:hypothetical protein